MRRREYSSSVEGGGLVFVAVYGSLRKGLGLHHRIGHMPFIGQGVLKGGDLYSYGPFPALVLRDDESKEVTVEVYAVDYNTLKILDGIEGGYDRDVVTIHFESGATCQALIYTQTPRDVAGKPHVPGGDWTEYKRQHDWHRASIGQATDGWGPRDIFSEA